MQNKYGLSKDAQDHGKAKDALKGATKRGNITILERKGNDCQYRARITEPRLNEFYTRRRDEEAKIDRIHNTKATEKQRR